MGSFKRPPITRHESLAPFSRDHYIGLVQARHLIRSAEQDNVARRKAVAEFVDAWNHEIAEHFQDEERLLLDLMQEPERQRLLREHQQLAQGAADARELRRQIAPDPATLKRLGELLDQHIRWEERELFVRLQEQLTDEQLNLLQTRTAQIEASRRRNVHRQTCRESVDSASNTNREI